MFFRPAFVWNNTRPGGAVVYTRKKQVRVMVGENSVMVGKAVVVGVVGAAPQHGHRSPRRRSFVECAQGIPRLGQNRTVPPAPEELRPGAKFRNFFGGSVSATVGFRPTPDVLLLLPATPNLGCFSTLKSDSPPSSKIPKDTWLWLSKPFWDPILKFGW